MMTLCVCGDTFQAAGDPADVQQKHKAWAVEHASCVKTPREGTKTFWMSFCDTDRPKGSQFLGACVIDVSAAEADECEIELLLKFPLAEADAEWIAAATKKAHRLGCNPGGEIATAEIPSDNPLLSHYARGVLMDRATIERIDAEIDSSVSAEAPHQPKA